MDTKQLVLTAAARVPKPTAAELARELGVSRERVRQIASALGLKLPDGRGRTAQAVGRTWTNHFGGESKLPSTFLGAAGELIAASALMARGIPVYRCCAPVGSFDLVAVIGVALIRVEVRCAKRAAGGHLQYARSPSDRYDVLALVTGDGAVAWLPNPGIDWPIE